VKALAVYRSNGSGVRVIDVPKPELDQIPDGRGALVRVLRVGVDGTDKEILRGEYGMPPPGEDFLISGHESFGVIEAVGPNAGDLVPGDFVVATVRRPGTSRYDAIGTSDMTTDDVYFERGINLRHGFLAEYYVEDAEYLVRIPKNLKEIGVLLEPASVVEKGIAQAYEIQRRLRVWQPRTAAVLGAGTIGLLATLALRVRGFEVHTFAIEPPPTGNSQRVEALGARYHATKERPFIDAAAALPPLDVIFEATGYAPLVFDALEVLGKNGVLILSSVTGGSRTYEICADRINLNFVLGNKVMVGTVNANREYFETGVKDLAIAEARWPGWCESLVTHRVRGLENHAELLDLLCHGTGAIKVLCEVAPLP
jgi:threonine dehydrogenase-like Zn-dependent dehydrogenase